MSGFILISKNGKESKISAVEGLTIAEVLQMLQAAQQYFTTLLIQEAIKKQEEIKEEP